jgi:hypothetical protein
MSQMEWFLGKWHVRSRYRDEGGQWADENLTTEHTTILGGHVIFEHFGGPLFGEPFEAWSLRKFNPSSNRWEQRWVDVSPGGFADWTGSWSQETATFTGHPNRVLDEDGNLEQEAAREVFFDISEDSFRWKYERTSDGGATWEPVWTLDYEQIQ